MWVIGAIGSSAALWCFWRLSEDARKRHRHLDHLKTEAMYAEKEEQLEDILVSLCLYADKHCWHSQLRNHAREVRAFIKGRIQKEESDVYPYESQKFRQEASLP